MECVKCGEYLDRRHLQADGSVVCPGCGAIYRRKSTSTSQRPVAPRTEDTENRSADKESHRTGSGSKSRRQSRPSPRYTETNSRDGRKRTTKRRATSQKAIFPIVAVSAIVFLGVSAFAGYRIISRGTFTTKEPIVASETKTDINVATADVPASTQYAQAATSPIDTRTEWEKLFADGPLRAGTDEGDGYIDIHGDWIVKPDRTIYQNLSSFREGLAPVQLASNHLWGYMDATGSWAIEPRFKSLGFFVDGIARVQEGELHGYIDRTGNYIISPRFEAAEDFDNGHAAVIENGLCGLIDTTGKYIIEPKYEIIGDFCDGLAVALGAPNSSDYGKCGFIDEVGNVVIPFEYGMATNFSNGRAFASYVMYNRTDIQQNPEIGWYLIDKNNRKYGMFRSSIFDFDVDIRWYAREYTFFTDYATKANQIIDRNGNVVLTDDGRDFRIDSEYGIYDTKADRLLVPARSRATGKEGYLDLSGNWVLDPVYYSVSSTINPKTGKQIYCTVVDDGSGSSYRQYFDEDFNIFYSSQGQPYHIMSNSTTGNFISAMDNLDNGNYGVVDENGNVVYDFIYEGCSVADDESYIRVRYQGLCGYIGPDGSYLVPVKFDYIMR